MRLLPVRRRDDTGLVGVAPRAGHEDQRGYPSLGPGLKFDDLARCEYWCAEGGKKSPGFVFVECEVALADVSDPRSRAPPRSRQRGVGTARDHEAQLRGETLDDGDEGRDDRRVAKYVEVLEHELQRTSECGRIIEELRDEQRGIRPAPRRELFGRIERAGPARAATRLRRTTRSVSG